jgi:hypothetical protein
MDCIANGLSRVGYKRASARIYLTQIARFSRFAGKAGHEGPASIDRNIVERYLLEVGTTSAKTAVNHAARFIRERFPEAREQEEAAENPHGPLLAAFEMHLRQVRGLQPRTCEGMILIARRVLD